VVARSERAAPVTHADAVKAQERRVVEAADVCLIAEEKGGLPMAGELL